MMKSSECNRKMTLLEWSTRTMDMFVIIFNGKITIIHTCIAHFLCFGKAEKVREILSMLSKARKCVLLSHHTGGTGFFAAAVLRWETLIGQTCETDYPFQFNSSCNAVYCWSPIYLEDWRSSAQRRIRNSILCSLRLGPILCHESWCRSSSVCWWTAKSFESYEQ